MNTDQIAAAFEVIFDQALVYHGFTDYMRDYELIAYCTADPRTGIRPEYVRYLFTHCVEAHVRSSVSEPNWALSLDERLIDYETGVDLDGFVWGVKWHCLYPGLTLVADSARTDGWSSALGIPFHEARIQTEAHDISLLFSGLIVTRVEPGWTPFVVEDGDGPDFKTPLA